MLVSWLALKNPLSALLLLGIRASPARRAERKPAFGN
jgi:hypothetical protein